MKFHPRWAATALFVVALGASSVSNANLIDRGGGLIYDQDLNITWLSNANVNGAMNWLVAMTWADNLSYGGYTDWRLPTSDTCSGYNCAGSELGHLFYTELGGVAGSGIATTHNTNYDLFQNLQSGNSFWSSTEYLPDTTWAWLFASNNGGQDVTTKVYSTAAWAVRPGDVVAVPVPAAMWLFGSGLLGLIGVARCKKTSA